MTGRHFFPGSVESTANCGVCFRKRRAEPHLIAARSFVKSLLGTVRLAKERSSVLSQRECQSDHRTEPTAGLSLEKIKKHQTKKGDLLYSTRKLALNFSTPPNGSPCAGAKMHHSIDGAPIFPPRPRSRLRFISAASQATALKRHKGKDGLAFVKLTERRRISRRSSSPGAHR